MSNSAQPEKPEKAKGQDNKIGKADVTFGAVSAAIPAAAGGALIGTVVAGPIGAVVGAAVGAATGGIFLRPKSHR